MLWHATPSQLSHAAGVGQWALFGMLVIVPSRILGSLVIDLAGSGGSGVSCALHFLLTRHVLSGIESRLHGACMDWHGIILVFAVSLDDQLQSWPFWTRGVQIKRVVEHCRSGMRYLQSVR